MAIRIVDTTLSVPSGLSFGFDMISVIILVLGIKISKLLLNSLEKMP